MSNDILRADAVRRREFFGYATAFMAAAGTGHRAMGGATSPARLRVGKKGAVAAFLEARRAELAGAAIRSRRITGDFS